MPPGPPPKRSEERRRRNKQPDGIELTKVNLDEVLAGEVDVPVADENWEPLTRKFWDSFQSSGQAIWYEPTDWMTAYTLMEVLDRWLKPQEIRVGEREVVEIDPEGDGEAIVRGKDYLFEEKIVAIPGATLNAILKGLTALMANEGDRRKLRIELERKKAIDAALGSDGVVVSMVKTREELFK